MPQVLVWQGKLRIYIVKEPLERFAMKLLPQSHPLTDVTKISVANVWTL